MNLLKKILGMLAYNSLFVTCLLVLDVSKAQAVYAAQHHNTVANPQSGEDAGPAAGPGIIGLGYDQEEIDYHILFPMVKSSWSFAKNAIIFNPKMTCSIGLLYIIKKFHNLYKKFSKKLPKILIHVFYFQLRIALCLLKFYIRPV